MNVNKHPSMKELRYAFRQTIPVMLGYIFLGIAFGLMLSDAGYHFLWAFASSVVIYAGSMQFVMVTLLASGAGLLSTAVMTLFINGRHLFYGLSLVERYRQMGGSLLYMIFSLTDETYSLLCGIQIPKELNEKKTMLYISALDHSYWVIGSLIGGLAGQLLRFDSRGIEFCMTALFIAISVEQWREKENRLPAVIGGGGSLAFLLLLGPGGFILPALTLSVCLLLLLRLKAK